MPEPPTGPLELPRSGIRIEGGVLLKADETGEVVGRHRLADIREVDTISEWPLASIPLLCLVISGDVVCLGLSLLGAPDAADRIWLGLFVLSILCLVGLLVFRRIVVRIWSGPAEVRWVIRDPRKECEAFVAALRLTIKRRRTGTGTGA